MAGNHKAGGFVNRVVIYGVFTLPDTNTDFTFTDTGTDTDTMGFKPNCIGVGLGVGQCEHTITQWTKSRSRFYIEILVTRAKLEVGNTLCKQTGF